MAETSVPRSVEPERVRREALDASGDPFYKRTEDMYRAHLRICSVPAMRAEVLLRQRVLMGV